MTTKTPRIRIAVSTRYLDDQSDPINNQYAFSYTISVSNQGNNRVQLLSRHWVIADANGKTREVRGDGVVGEQPVITPGETFKYTSGAVLETPVGSMHGSYGMVDEDGAKFDAAIDAFSLTASTVTFH